MSATTDENPCQSPAWLGYYVENEETTWRVCGWCPLHERDKIRKEAERLCIKISHGMCPTCYKREMGEFLPGFK